MNIPPGVLGRILTKSVGTVFSLRSRSKFSDNRSVRLSDCLTGISARSLLIQKTIMSGITEKPIRVQPNEYLKNSKTIM